jgi:carboxypeptidase family protein
MRRFMLTIAVFVSFVVVPTAAYAQASIAGSVKDSSGAVLPGVTVEVSSPALIEKTRSVVTDGTGHYTIVDLRPGTYAVTFSLTGFSTVKREGIELTGTFVATVNADMKVGAVSETITVTGETPVVDVKSARNQQTLDAETIAAIPSGRQYFSLTTLVPALNVQGNDVGAASGPIFSVFQIHGGRRNEGQVRVEGLNAGFQGMGVSFYVPDVGNAQEVTFSLSGGLGEAETGGPQMNIIPRQGGNLFSGTVFVNGANGSMQGDNFTPALAAVLRSPNKLQKLWDANLALGGPIKKDRLWFYWTFRHQGNRQAVAGMYNNLNAGDPTKWTYSPDYNNQAVDDGTWKNSSLRVTWQVTPRNKTNFWWDEQAVCQHCLGGGILTGFSPSSPEAQGRTQGYPQRMAQANWSSPVSSRLLLEASFGIGPDIQFGGEQKNAFDKDMIQVQEQAALSYGIPNLVYRAAFWSRPYGKTRTVRAALSYVTGSNAAKFGVQYQYNWELFVNFYNNSQLQYRFNNGVPNLITMFGLQGARQIVTQGMTGLYAQDQWTRGRLTLQGGIRFEHIGAGFPDQSIGPNRFIPVALTFPAQDAGVSPKELMPRMGVAYDLFGNGKTGLKLSVGRYVTSENSFGTFGNAQNPAARVTGTTTRVWQDLNQNFAPDCDLLNPAANGECSQWLNQTFGQPVLTTNYDPAILNGWNVREYSWDITGTVDQQLAPRVSVELSYARRIWGNLTTTENRALHPNGALGPVAFDPFTLTAPSDARLPGGGAYPLTFYDVKPAYLGQFDNFVTSADNFGGATNHYNGVDVTVKARLPFALTAQGGFSTGKVMEDDCAVGENLPEINVGGIRQPQSFCHRETPFLTNYKGLAAYTVPKIDVQISGTFQSKPYVGANAPSVSSQSLAGNWVVFNSLIAPSLGRNLATGPASVAIVNLVQPGTKYGDRLNQIDLRFGKLLHYGRTRTLVALDLFNAFNSNTIDNYVQTFGSAYLNAASITAARIAKVSVQFDF